MLGKLIKYEWKSISRVGILMLIGTLLASACAFISFRSPMWMRLMSGVEVEGFTPFDLLGILGLIVYITILICISYGMMIYLGIHFYKSMYSNQGYLTHTLPVTPHQLLISKILVGGLWNLIIAAMVIFSVIVLVVSLLFTVFSLQYPGMSTQEIISMMEQQHYFGNMYVEIEAYTGGSFVSYIVILLITMAAGCFYGTAQLYGAVTLGQLSRKHKVLMSIVAYIGISTFNSIVGTLISFINSFSTIVKNVAANGSAHVYYSMNRSYVVILIHGILLGVILYFLSHYIITKKLNLD